MSKRKHHKKRKRRKPSRRERRAGVERQVKRPAAPVTDSTTAPEAPKEAAAAGPEPEPAPQPAGAQATRTPPPTVSATFRPAAKSDATVELEQRYVGRDLRRLLVQLAAFTLIIVGFAVLDAQTDAIGNLGSSLFTLWE